MSEKPMKTMELSRLGQRFIDPAVEADYRRWRKVEAFPVMWLGAIAATLSWISLIPTLYFFAPNYYAELDQLVYLTTLVFGLGTAAGLVQGIRPSMIWVVSAMNLYAGTLLALVNYFVGDSLGAAASGSILVMLYAPFMRLPPLQVLFACGPYAGLVTGLAVFEIQQGQLGEWETVSYLLIPGMGFMTVLLVCGVIEAFLRRSYTREQLIIEQQRGLEDSRRMIRRYAPPAVVDQIIAGKGESVDQPQRRRITVLFSDIVGFTDIADRVDAESLTQIINEYMAAMAEIVDAHQGTVNEFIGDGVMALFGAPLELDPETQARQAIAAAQTMQSKMPELHQGWRKLGLDEELKIRIGINTGVLSVGSFGSEGRVTYTAIGLQTNIAARIQSHCEPGGILISNATYQLVDEVIDCEPKGEVECKGVHFPVKVYAPRKQQAT